MLKNFTFKSFIRYVDLFGVSFQFMIEKEQTFKSITGGLISILFLIIFILLFIYKFFKIIDGDSREKSYFRKHSNNNQDFDAKRFGFFYFLKINIDENINLQEFNYENLFEFKLAYKHFNEILISDIQGFKCSEALNYFDPRLFKYPFPSDIKDFGDNYYCFNFNDENYDNNTLLKNRTNHEITISLNYTFIDELKNNFYGDLKKNNFDNDDNTENEEFIKELFSNYTFDVSFYFSDSDFMQLHREEAIDGIFAFPRRKRFTLDLNYVKKLNLFFDEINFKYDKNLLYNNYQLLNKSLQYATYDSYDIPFYNRFDKKKLKINQEKELAKITLYPRNTLFTIYYKNKKLIDVISFVGSLLANTLVFLKIIMHNWNHCFAKEEILEKFVKYKDIMNKENKNEINELNKLIIKNIGSKNESIIGNKINVYNDNKENPFNIKTDFSLNETNKNQNEIFINNLNIVNDEANHDYNILKINNNDYKDTVEKRDRIYCYSHNKNKFKKNLNENYFSKESDSLNKVKESNRYSLQEVFYKREYAKNMRNKIEEQNFLLRETILDKNIRKDYIESEIININKNYLNINQNKTHLNESEITVSFISNNKIKNKYSFYRIFKIIFICFRRSKKREKLKIIKLRAEEKFKLNIDIVTLLKKIQEIDIIKYLILDVDSLNILNFICKPSISEEKELSNYEYEKFFNNEESVFKYKKENFDELISSYINLSNKENLNRKEKRLMNLFAKQIKELCFEDNN